MSTYVPVSFEDGVTPLNAETFNHLEDQVELLDALKVPDPAGLDEKWLKAESGAMVWVDAPVGGGGAIEYENAWAAATPYQPGDVVIHEGVEYLAVNPSTGDEPDPIAPAVQTFTPIPLVTNLPVTPFDGQEVILTDSLTAPTYNWRLRYNAGSSSSFKWEFLGGSPLSAYNSAAQTMTTAGAFADLATVGPSIFVPRAGNYELTINAGIAKSAVDNNVQLAACLGATQNVALQAVGSEPVVNYYLPYGASGQAIGLPAGTEVRLRYYQSAAGTLTAAARYLGVRPVRLS